MTVLDDEDPIDSCRAIVHFLKHYENGKKGNDRIREALIEDLCWKSTRISTSLKATLLSQGLYHLLPQRVRKLFSPEILGLDALNTLPSHLVKHRHVGIITVLKAELDAVRKVFGIDAKPESDGGIFRYWSGEVERSQGARLSVSLMQVGEARNVPCAIAVNDMLNRYSVDLMMLIGIAAGPREKVKLGDVVAANWVYDYEHARRELIDGKKVEKMRPYHLPVHKNINADLMEYDKSWTKNRLVAIMRNPDEFNLPVPLEKFNPKWHVGTIAAGEKLFADGSLEELRSQYDDEIRAGDQEDSGFAQACVFRDVSWCVFRGIADYGDPKKNKKWHPAASLTAASAAYAFLQQAYRLPSTESL